MQAQDCASGMAATDVYRRVFKISIQFTVRIWFGTDAATCPAPVHSLDRAPFQQLAKCPQLQPRRFKWERIRQEIFVCKVRRAPPTTMHSISTAMASAETPIRRSIGRITVAGRMKPAMRDALKRCHTARENEIAAFGNWNAISRPPPARDGDDTHASNRADPSFSGAQALHARASGPDPLPCGVGTIGHGGRAADCHGRRTASRSRHGNVRG